MARKLIAPTINPWVPEEQKAPTEEFVERDTVFGDVLVVKGPATPATAPAVARVEEHNLQYIEMVDAPEICVMGLHGGAGASAVTSLLGEAGFDTERRWPIYTGWMRPRPALKVIAVARTHRQGLEAATEFATMWAAGQLIGAELLGIVLVDDAPKLLKGQISAVKRIGQMTPRGWHLGWNETWRLEKPSTTSATIRARKIVENMRANARKVNP